MKYSPALIYELHPELNFIDNTQIKSVDLENITSQLADLMAAGTGRLVIGEINSAKDTNAIELSILTALSSNISIMGTRQLNNIKEYILSQFKGEIINKAAKQIIDASEIILVEIIYEQGGRKVNNISII